MKLTSLIARNLVKSTSLAQNEVRISQKIRRAYFPCNSEFGLRKYFHALTTLFLDSIRLTSAFA
jgi:hypothetical protein